ncbi:MAG: hypothetical protein ACRDJG_05855 [Actinomycetota bacterium]
MRFEATCNTCGRRFLLIQILPSADRAAGRCPFCGARFGRHYLPLLPEAITKAEASAEEFLGSFKKLTGLHPGFQIDTGNLLARLAEEMGRAPESESA